MSIEDWTLGFEGFSEQQIAQIHAALPDVEHLMDILKAEMPRINKVVPVLQMVIAVVNAKQKQLQG